MPPPLTSSSAPDLAATVAPAPITPQCSQPSASLGLSHLHAKLVLLKHAAEQVSVPSGRRPQSEPPTYPPGPRALLFTLVGGRKEPTLPQGGLSTPCPRIIGRLPTVHL